MSEAEKITRPCFDTEGRALLARIIANKCKNKRFLIIFCFFFVLPHSGRTGFRRARGSGRRLWRELDYGRGCERILPTVVPEIGRGDSRDGKHPESPPPGGASHRRCGCAVAKRLHGRDIVAALLGLFWRLLREGRLKVARGRSWQPEIGMEHASRGRRSGNKGVGARWRGRFRNDDVVFFFGGCSGVGGGFFHTLRRGRHEGVRFRATCRLRRGRHEGLGGIGGLFHTLRSGHAAPCHLRRDGTRGVGFFFSLGGCSGVGGRFFHMLWSAHSAPSRRWSDATPPCGGAGEY